MSKSDPPKWANWLLQNLYPESSLEEVQGDLHEASSKALFGGFAGVLFLRCAPALTVTHKRRDTRNDDFMWIWLCWTTNFRPWSEIWSKTNKIYDEWRWYSRSRCTTFYLQ
ncbi:MAG: permease prefix domain 2-containing transporter [Cyclobacteriaceae bacterium]